MTIEKMKNGNQLTLNVAGRLDTSTAPQFEALINSELADVNELVIDCQELEYISSAGLRVLLKAQKKMAVVGSMKLQHVNEENMEVFAITGFDSILTIE